MISNSAMKLLNISVQGASHVATGRECQDASGCYRSPDGRMSAVVVSDGHGGSAYPNSATGARLAVEVTLQMLKSFCSNTAVRPDEKQIEQLCRSIVANWTMWVGADGEGEISTYGCTLIAYALTDTYWFALQIGDGRCCILNHRNKWRQPIPSDDRCILNLTTSLCGEDAGRSFRYVSGVKRPKAVMLCSDGVDGTFGSGALLYNFYNQVLRTLRMEGFGALKDQLPGVLRHYSATSSKDDMSLALLVPGEGY